MTVYEAEEIAGGMLAYAIPEYRLPQDILQKEINTLKQIGIQIKLGMEVGKDITLFNIGKDSEADEVEDVPAMRKS